MTLDGAMDAQEQLSVDRGRLKALGRVLVAQESELLAERDPQCFFKPRDLGCELA